jgi:hypothetical protein
MSREERGRKKEDRQAISGPAHRLMLSLRCVGFGFPQLCPASYRLARRGMEQRLGPGWVGGPEASAQV